MCESVSYVLLLLYLLFSVRLETAGRRFSRFQIAMTSVRFDRCYTMMGRKGPAEQNKKPS
jgi:hypothetical protein